MNKPDERVNTGLLLDFYGEMLTERQREIMTYCYMDDLSLSEIAELTGITRQGVRAVEMKSRMILERCEVRLGLLARFLSVQDSLRTLVDAMEGAKHGGELQLDAWIETVRSLL